jgi:hypothetical protein
MQQPCWLLLLCCWLLAAAGCCCCYWLLLCSSRQQQPSAAAAASTCQQQQLVWYITNSQLGRNTRFLYFMKTPILRVAPKMDSQKIAAPRSAGFCIQGIGDARAPGDFLKSLKFATPRDRSILVCTFLTPPAGKALFSFFKKL